MRLNKYLAHAGLGTRRQTEALVKSGKISVNGQIEVNPGRSVSSTDEVVYDGKPISYDGPVFALLLNKPKKMTIDGSRPLREGWRQLSDILDDKSQVSGSSPDEIPLDMTGLLIWTNDQQILENLQNPETVVSSVYHLSFKREIEEGLLSELSGEFISKPEKYQIKSLNFISGKSHSNTEVEYTGKSPEQLCKLFEKHHLIVDSIDRTYYAGLTKKALGRGRYRSITEEESTRLRHFRFL